MWCFFAEGAAADAWVADRAHAIREGNARQAAFGIGRRASTLGVDAAKRIKADPCATYLTSKAPYLDYPTPRREGWPIAPGVIEGTCRFLVADRIDITASTAPAPPTPVMMMTKTTCVATNPIVNKVRPNGAAIRAATRRWAPEIANTVLPRRHRSRRDPTR